MPILRTLATTIISALTFAAAYSQTQDVDIIMNGADWDGLREALANSSDRVVSIVHIGDSHLQGDKPTSHLRREFQKKYGDAGRGIVSPFKLSGSYQPGDYEITSSSDWTAARFLKYPWTVPNWFNGTAMRPNGTSADITVTLKEQNEERRTFQYACMLHRGSMKVTAAMDELGASMQIETTTMPDHWTDIALDHPVSSLTLRLEPDPDFVFHAMELSNGNPGVLYNTIGNGAADIGMYLLMDDLGGGVAQLEPDLIILALGTNDSYNNYTDEKFTRNLDRIVTRLQENNPDTPLLLVTPMEIELTKTTTVKTKVKGKRGRYRTVNKKVKNRSVVTGVSRLREVMLQYASDKNLAVYDWYTATGGAGAAKRWVSDGLMSGDYVHLTSEGYRLHASMLYGALERAIEGDRQ